MSETLTILMPMKQYAHEQDGGFAYEFYPPWWKGYFDSITKGNDWRNSIPVKKLTLVLRQPRPLWRECPTKMLISADGMVLYVYQTINGDEHTYIIPITDVLTAIQEPQEQWAT